ncbi:phage tail sheath C-terminal domain-containing protein [Anaerotruncus rubiinfantis]|uniref:phage tail sheath C-terminal domain-containing protein n=1 Tax=Anaerotruncus rubiinfantis TaxID=1720200 RepID=UPI00082AD1D4|nr:phage tail sheath C-terminal domain-containing protein [Anaerotruncus rubiinfantis]
MIHIPTTMRPGVFTDLRVHAAAACGMYRGIAAVARTVSGEPGEATLVRDPAQAAVFGTDSALYEMIKALLEAGASQIYAIPAGEDYTAAFAAAERLPVYLLVCDGGADVLAAHISACCENGRERIGLLAVSDPTAAAAAAGTLNHPHIAVICDGGDDTHVTAAAFAAAVARFGASGSLNGLPVRSVGGSGGTLTAAQAEMLLAAGAIPFEVCGGEAVCVRAVTSCTKDADGEPDATFRDLSTVLAVDEVLDTVRRAVKARLRGCKNNAATRESIASQITVELEAMRARGILDSYRPPVVAAHPQDSAVCVATLGIRVAPEISQIVLRAEITV